MSMLPPINPAAAQLKTRAAAFVESELHPLERRIAERGTFDAEELSAVRAKARAAGFSMYNMPRSCGERDFPMLAQVAIEEEAGKATNGIGFLVADRGPRELCEMCSAEQVERYILPIVRGDTREAWAVTEPGAGSDVNGIRATARRQGEGWVINGEKWFVTGSDSAGFYIVMAWAEEDGEREQTLFLVEAGNPGLRTVRTPEFMHDPYISKHAEIVFENCLVPEMARVRSSGDAGAKAWFTAERLFIAARSCGSAERLIGLCRDWAQERKAFGSSLSEYQSVQMTLADSLTELAAARLLTYHAAQEFDAGTDAKIVHGKVAMAKLYASEMVGRVADRAVQLFGGRGFMTECAANRYYREVRVDRIWEGTSEIQRLIIGRALLKRGAAPYVS